MSIAYRITLGCGLIPLFTGTTIFFVWLILRESWLEIWGLYTINAGLILFCIGIISLIIYFVKAISKKTDKYWKKSIIALSILLANFPAAGLIISAVMYFMSFSIVTIENNSNFDIENIYLYDQSHQYTIGSVSPHENIEKEIQFKSEGSVSYTCILDGVEYKGLILGYVTPGLSTSAKMKITESGNIEVEY